MIHRVLHTPAGADDYNVCDTYDTRAEAIAAMLEVHLRFEQMDPAGSLDITLTFVDGDPLIVTPAHGFYAVDEVDGVMQRIYRIVFSPTEFVYAVRDQRAENGYNTYASLKRAELHNPDAHGPIIIVTEAEFVAALEMSDSV